VRFAVVRLDGDLLIADDYIDWKTCRTAVDQYRKRHRIDETLIVVPHTRDEMLRGVMRGAYWRKRPAPGQVLCAECPRGALRPAGAILHNGTSAGGRREPKLASRRVPWPGGVVRTAHVC
jgi:hypothetical protein